MLRVFATLLLITGTGLLSGCFWMTGEFRAFHDVCEVQYCELVAAQVEQHESSQIGVNESFVSKAQLSEIATSDDVQVSSKTVNFGTAEFAFQLPAMPQGMRSASDSMAVIKYTDYYVAYYIFDLYQAHDLLDIVFTTPASRLQGIMPYTKRQLRKGYSLKGLFTEPVKLSRIAWDDWLVFVAEGETSCWLFIANEDVENKMLVIRGKNMPSSVQTLVMNTLQLD
ncbi:hypothetical protein [Zooshikella harenae]|uniref:Lipoprotein n=1 Tax=Zooshikella harenae TaxID=2827238 RepID=A0ABS5ZAL0_9GAMM|nr:hypothetical protein [Zooshikella harenae]MBU2711065.1 hypothetical protein [Zooshikella harenae]